MRRLVAVGEQRRRHGRKHFMVRLVMRMQEIHNVCQVATWNPFCYLNRHRNSESNSVNSREFVWTMYGARWDGQSRMILLRVAECVSRPHSNATTIERPPVLNPSLIDLFYVLEKLELSIVSVGRQVACLCTGADPAAQFLFTKHIRIDSQS